MLIPAHLIMALIGAGPLLAPDHASARAHMVKSQIESRGIHNPAVLKSMRETPRHSFVPDTLQARAYDDTPLPIGLGQTISQPYIVASMTQMLDAKPHHRVLEIGTGSGYQAAVLSPLVAHIYSIEIIESLALEARQRLAKLGYRNITVRIGDGYAGWPEEAPFDRIILTAAPPELPLTLVKQLKRGGRLVAPVGGAHQELIVVDIDAQGRVHRRTEYPVMFVPMVPGKR